MKEQQVERVPISQKVCLTPYEAAEYSNLGINRIFALLKEPNCPFVLFVGEGAQKQRKLVKRKEFEEFLAGSLTV